MSTSYRVFVSSWWHDRTVEPRFEGETCMKDGLVCYITASGYPQASENTAEGGGEEFQSSLADAMRGGQDGCASLRLHVHSVGYVSLHYP